MKQSHSGTITLVAQSQTKLWQAEPTAPGIRMCMAAIVARN
jgi:hypothetical protein